MSVEVVLGSDWSGLSMKTEMGDLKMSSQASASVRGAVGRDGQTKFFQLVGGARDVLEGILQRVRGLAVGTQQRVEDALEKGMAGVLCVQHTDRRDGHGQREVAPNLAESARALGRGDGAQHTSSA